MIPLSAAGSAASSIVPCEANEAPSSVTLLMRMDGTEGATTFTDISLQNHTITSAGNATQTKVGPPPIGEGSAVFDKSDGTDMLSIPNGAWMQTGSDDFTCDMWVNAGDTANSRYIAGCRKRSASSGGNWYLNIGADDVITCVTYQVGGSGTGTHTAGVYPSGWFHLALVRDSGFMRIFVDGIHKVSNAITGTFDTSDNFTVGDFYPGFSDTPFDGKIAEVRFVNGVAAWTGTGNFTPPEKPWCSQ